MKTIYMIWYKSKHNQGPCYRGREPYWTTDVNSAKDYMEELKEYSKDFREDATFSIVSFNAEEDENIS